MSAGLALHADYDPIPDALAEHGAYSISVKRLVAGTIPSLGIDVGAGKLGAPCHGARAAVRR